MNTKKLFQNLTYILLGSVIAIGLSYVVHAASFTGPFTPPGCTMTGAANPPACNTSVPLNVGNDDQVKQGGLSVTTFIANQNAQLDGGTYFGGTLHADPANANSTISFGGTDPMGIVRSVALAINGGFSDTGSITSAPLANTSSTPVCADANGTVVLCTATDICSNISGVQTTVPSGDVANSDGTCSVAPKRFYSIIADNDKSIQSLTNNVVNSNVVFHVANTPANALPLVAILGLNNDFPYGWQVDDFGTEAHSTTFGTANVTDISNANSYSQLLSPTEAGTYNFKISSQGKLGIEGKFPADLNTIGVDFYMRIHNNSTNADQWYDLNNGKTEPVNGGGETHEAYPVPNKTSFAFGAISNDNSTPVFFGITLGLSGDDYTYVPYNFTFQKSLTLSADETINLYAFVYGKSVSGDGSLLTGALNHLQGESHNGANNFTYSLESPYQGTTIDITDTP